MKNLKELNEKCTLIAEFNNPAFVCNTVGDIINHRKKTKCALYGDNKGTYYIYKYINDSRIELFEDYELAMDVFKRFVGIILER